MSKSKHLIAVRDQRGDNKSREYVLHYRARMIAAMSKAVCAADLRVGFRICWTITPRRILNPKYGFEYNVHLELVVPMRYCKGHTMRHGSKGLALTCVEFIITHDEQWFWNSRAFSFDDVLACGLLIECITKGFCTTEIGGGKNYRCLNVPPRRSGERILLMYPEQRVLLSTLGICRDHPQFKLLCWVFGLMEDTLAEVLAHMPNKQCTISPVAQVLAGDLAKPCVPTPRVLMVLTEDANRPVVTPGMLTH